MITNYFNYIKGNAIYPAGAAARECYLRIEELETLAETHWAETVQVCEVRTELELEEPRRPSRPLNTWWESHLWLSPPWRLGLYISSSSSHSFFLGEKPPPLPASVQLSRVGVCLLDSLSIIFSATSSSHERSKTSNKNSRFCTKSGTKCRGKRSTDTWETFVRQRCVTKLLLSTAIHLYFFV